MGFPYGISVFFPAYNDAKSLPALLSTAFDVLEGAAADFEVIVVNDGSRDDTADVLTRLSGVYGERMRVVTHGRNMGYGAALRSGFQAARKEFVFYTDGDGQYDVRELPRLLEKAGPGVGLVNGFKTVRHDPKVRVIIGSLYNRLVRRLFGLRIRDVDCDFRLVYGQIIRQRPLRCNSGTVCVELVRAVQDSGMRIEEAPVSHYPRHYGRSEFFRVGPLAATVAQLGGLYMRCLFRTKDLAR